MTVGIYGIFDAETDECLYVGLSRTIEIRWKNHLKNLKRGNHLEDFITWFEKHGKETKSMRFEILEQCEPKDKLLNLLELKWFNMLSPKFAGKISSVNEKWQHSDETKAKIRASVRESVSRRGLQDRRVKGICVTCGGESVSFKSRFCSNECKYKHRVEKTFHGENLEIIKRYTSGESSTSIAESYGTTYMAVLRLLRFEKITIRPRNSTKKIS